MAHSAAAENRAGEKDKDRDKDKVEKRRALGRGLESLLPGPRAVGNTTERAAGSAVELRSTGQPRAAVPTQTSPSATGSGAAGNTQVPHFVRNDNPPGDGADLGEEAAGEAFGGTIQAVAEEIPAAPTQDEGITIMAQAEGRAPGNLVANLAIADIDKNPFQTRYVDTGESLEQLAESIKASGVLQPIVVRPAEVDR